MDTTINVEFKLGKGQLTIAHLRDGSKLNEQDLKTTGGITFNDTQVGDGISIAGACTGTATVKIDTITEPPTPVVYQKGVIFGKFDLI